MNLANIILFKNGSSSKDNIYNYVKNCFEIILPKNYQLITCNTRSNTDKNDGDLYF